MLPRIVLLGRLIRFRVEDSLGAVATTRRVYCRSAPAGILGADGDPGPEALNPAAPTSGPPR